MCSKTFVFSSRKHDLQKKGSEGRKKRGHENGENGKTRHTASSSIGRVPGLGLLIIRKILPDQIVFKKLFESKRFVSNLHIGCTFTS